MKIGIVTCSTRPGRKGPAISDWLMTKSGEIAGAEASLIDLAEFRLPIFDEANHPRSGEYEHAHTIAFSKVIAATDAFVFVIPEYNHNPPASLVNAVTFLNGEWSYKPLAFASYGGVSGGLRSVHVAKPLFSAFNAVPISEGVVIPFLAKALDEDGRFSPSKIQDDAAAIMIQELGRWHSALKALRARG